MTSIILLSLLLVTVSLAAAPAREGWTLTFHDDFDGTVVDETKWEIVRRRDCPNQELQYYVPEQAAVAEGRLRLTAIKKELDGKAYQSAMVKSHFTQSHGRFEARLKLPRTQGMWPAFWLLPRPPEWPHRGEIDIMESKGRDTKWTSSAYHFFDKALQKHRYVWQAYVPKNAAGEPIDLAGGFHVYAAEWKAGEVKFFLDDAAEPYYTITAADAPISDEPMCVILNLAVGGWFDGEPDETTVLPQTLEVDWVRVWKRE